MTPFAIAGVQMYINALQPNTDGMIQRLDILMSRFPWTQMVLFSEIAPLGPLPKFSLPLMNEHIVKFQAAAARHNIWLIPGTMHETAEDGRIFNTAVVIGPDGQIVTTYRKMFPFRPYEAGIDAGTDFCIFDVPDVGRFGLSICYDIWIPETTRQLTAQGVEVLLLPVFTSTADREVEIAICQSTAAQFQCYVFSINGLGAGGNGRSCVIDPSGTLLHLAAGHEDSFPVEVDFDHVRRQRETGLKGLGQVLKSFRDRPIDFSVYDRNSGTDDYLKTLGTLQVPQQGTRAGLDVDGPAQAIEKLRNATKTFGIGGTPVPTGTSSG